MQKKVDSGQWRWGRVAKSPAFGRRSLFYDENAAAQDSSLAQLGKSMSALPSNQRLYQLSDNFTLFHYQFMANDRTGDAHFWTTSLNSPLHSTWSGLAFECLCFQHITQIQMSLGISASPAIAMHGYIREMTGKGHR